MINLNIKLKSCVNMSTEVFEAVNFLYWMCTNNLLGAIYYFFIEFKYNLLQLHHSKISRNRLFTCSVSISKDVPTYTSTVWSAYSTLSSLEHIRAKSLEHISKNKGPVFDPRITPSSSLHMDDLTASNSIHTVIFFSKYALMKSKLPPRMPYLSKLSYTI